MIPFKWKEIDQFIKPAPSRTLKRQLIKQGYQYQMSFYGALTSTEKQETQYRRIEMLSNTPYTERLIFLLYEFFKEYKNPFTYSIWIYDKQQDAIKLVAKYGKK